MWWLEDDDGDGNAQYNHNLFCSRCKPLFNAEEKIFFKTSLFQVQAVAAPGEADIALTVSSQEWVQPFFDRTQVWSSTPMQWRLKLGLDLIIRKASFWRTTPADGL